MDEVADKVIDRKSSALKPGVPSVVAKDEFKAGVRRYLKRRALLAALTRDPKLARTRDPVDELRYAWHTENKEREQLLGLLLGAARKPLQPDADDEELDQLVGL